MNLKEHLLHDFVILILKNHTELSVIIQKGGDA